MEQAGSQNRINEGTKLKGDIVSSGFFRVDGNIEGNISNPSKVVLGKTGVIVGKMICQDADIEGRFEGNLEVAGTLSLKSSAHIQGEVIVGKLAVEPGATFNATCKMRDSKSPRSTQAEPIVKMADTREDKSHPFDRSKRIQKTKAEQ